LSQRLLSRRAFDVCSVSICWDRLAASEKWQTLGIGVKGLNRRLYILVEGERMKLETNQISRDWTVLHDDRTFYVNYTQSDGHTLALCNRDNWEVLEETDDGPEELDIYVYKSDSLEGQSRANSNFRLMKKLIRFCIENWDNRFMRDIEEDLKEQKEALEAL